MRGTKEMDITDVRKEMCELIELVRKKALAVKNIAPYGSVAYITMLECEYTLDVLDDMLDEIESDNKSMVKYAVKLMKINDALKVMNNEVGGVKL